MSTYNGEPYLRAQLDSILSQTLKDWLLLVRDDGSKDRTSDILNEYAGRYPSKIRVLESSGQNAGVTRSYSLLMEECARIGADYIQMADQDDVWLPDKLLTTRERIVQEEQKHPAGENIPILVHTDMIVTDSNLQQTAPSFWKYVNIHPEILDHNIHFLAICNSVTGCATMFNKAALSVILPFPENIYMHDAWAGLKVLKSGGHLYAVSEPSLLYRQHDNNVCGATPYRFRLFNLKEKYKLAQHSYQTGHPLVFRNRLHFLWWKLLYFFKLHSL